MLNDWIQYVESLVKVRQYCIHMHYQHIYVLRYVFYISQACLDAVEILETICPNLKWSVQDNP